MNCNLNFCFILFLLLTLTNACSSDSEKINTGLAVYKEFDSTRLFDTSNSGRREQLYRPVKIDLYYPSTGIDSGDPLTYGDILNLYEHRMDYTVSMDSCKIMSNELAKVFADYLGVSDPNKIINYKTNIHLNLPLPSTKFPLIIYAAGMNGGSWENVLLFDSLTRAGYIVAAISSFGKFPGFMTAAEDLDEQVRDIMYAKRKLKSLPFVDGNKIGLMSWSMGGSAITKAAMLSNDFKCLLSFDGTEIHYYGIDSAWDKEFDKIKQIPPYIPERIAIPYLYVSSDRPAAKDSVYVFPQHINSQDNFFLKIKGAIHESFSSLIQVARAVEPHSTKLPGLHDTLVKKVSVIFFDQYLKRKKHSINKGTNHIPCKKQAGFV